MMKNFTVFQNYVQANCSLRHPDCNFDKLAIILPPTFGWNFAENVRKWWEEILFFSKAIIETVLCRHKIQFWQLCWKLFVKSLQKFRSRSMKWSKNFPKLMVLPECSSVVLTVWQSYQKFSAKSWFVSLLIVRKWWGESKFHLKKPQMIAVETLNAILMSLLETIAKSPKEFCSKTGNGEIL